MSTVTTPATTAEFLALYRKSGLYDEKPFRAHFGDDDELPADARQAAAALVRVGLLTNFQAKQLLSGRHRGFTLGTHRILEPIGQGGMGTVYLAEHTSLKRKVALKVLPSDKAKDRLSLERFQREARAAAALSHPNIVRLHDISQGGGVHFLVMEYVEGTDLQSLMGKTGPLHHAQAAAYVAQAAAGLAHAHGKGIVHRDIKPANLILAKDGTVKLLDLGLARSLTCAEDELTGTLNAGEVAGTADYIAPEQALCQPSDERADIYSLGATLYALVAGHPPFSGSTSQKLAQHQMKEPPNLTKKLSGRVPPALAEVVMTMMAKRPSERYQTAEEVIDALGPWLPAPSTGSVVGGPLSGMMPKPKTKTKRKKPKAKPAAGVPGWAWGAGGAALVALVGGVAWLAGGDSKPAARPSSGPPAVAAAAGPVVPPEPPFVRNPLAPLPGDAQFTPVSLASAYNVSSRRLKFAPNIYDALVTEDWSDRRVEGVPFTLVPPKDDAPNVVEMHSPKGLAAAMPKSVTVPVGVAAGKLHFLSGTGAWGYPWQGAGNEVGSTPLGNLVLRVVIRYEGGGSEDHRWESGVHFCDYVGAHDVPQSKLAVNFRDRRSVRYLAVEPASAAVIKEVEFVKNEADATAPLILAMTVEKPAPGGVRKPAPPRADRTLIPLQVPSAPGQPAAPVAAPAGPVKAEGVTFEIPAGTPGLVLGQHGSAKIGCFLAARELHLLGSVGPESGKGLARLHLHYAGGEAEDFEWKPSDGVAAGELRMLTLKPAKPGVVQYVSVENAGPTRAVVYGVTVEPR